MRRSYPAALALLLVSWMPALDGTLSAQTDPYLQQRLQMVEQQIERRGVSRPMKEVPRHLFVPESRRDEAYSDGPQPIGHGQTISQPYIVALMTELLELSGDEKVLEIGTGSGYQAAVLSRLTRDVYTIEIRQKLAEQARRTLDGLGYDNIHYRTAAPEEVPQTLIEQMKIGGRMVVPVGKYFQDLQVITRTQDGIRTEAAGGVRFVPMIKDED